MTAVLLFSALSVIVVGFRSNSPDAPDSKKVVPKYIDIKVLDAMNTPERSESTLKIYSAYVKGNHGENTDYYPDGSRLADVTIMADNIYENSDKAPDSKVSTKANPQGYTQTGKSYSPADFGGEDTNTYPAQGINAFGEGEELSLDIMGVDKDVVEAIVSNAQRNSYNEQKSVTKTPKKFKNKMDRIPFYNYDFRANNAVILLNDYVDTNRGVVFDTIYANNSYINTPDTNLSIQDGYINNYAEFRNNNKIAVVDNDFRRLVNPADVQLYTQKTGLFALKLNDTINMKTTAPTVYNEPHELVNGYHSQWNFVNHTFKENKDLLENKDLQDKINKNRYEESLKRSAMRFDTTNDTELISNHKIYDISTTGALIQNDEKLKKGKTTNLSLKFDDVDVTLKAKVVSVLDDKAGIKFIDMPKDVANKILYRYMQQKDSMKTNLSMSL